MKTNFLFGCLLVFNFMSAFELHAETLQKLSPETTLANEEQLAEQTLAAWGMMEEGAFDDSEVLLKEITESQPEFWLAQSVLGHLYLEQGITNKAQKQFDLVLEKAVAIESFNEEPLTTIQAVSWAHLGVGEILYDQEQYFQAEEFFLKALQPHMNPIAYSRLGMMARKVRQDLKLSETIHREIAEHYESFTSNQVALATLYRYQGRIVDAETIMRSLSPDDVDPFGLAAYYSVAGHIIKSVTTLEEMLEFYRHYPERQQQIIQKVLRDDDFKSIQDSYSFKTLIQKYS